MKAFRRWKRKVFAVAHKFYHLIKFTNAPLLYRIKKSSKHSSLHYMFKTLNILNSKAEALKLTIVLSRNFHSYGDVTITGEVLQILTYARHFRPSSSEGSLACPTYCDTGASVYNGHLWGPVRPRNINLQCWKYSSFVVSICHNQTIWRHNELSEYKRYGGRRRKHWIEIQFQSSFSIRLILHKLYWCQIIILTEKNHWFTIKSNINLNLFIAGNRWIENWLWNWNFNPMCFRRRSQQVNLRPLHCDIKCFDCIRWKSQTMYIFPILPVNLPRS